MEQLIKEYGLKNYNKVFDGIKSYKDLIEANVAFLEGRVAGSPTHLGPVDQETIPLLKNLVKINKMGFITLQGQPSECYHEKYIKKIWIKTHGKYIGDYFAQGQQKSYVVGILKRKYLKEFIDFFRNEKTYYYLIEGKEGLITTTFPEEYYNVSRDRINKNKSEVKKEPWSNSSNISIEGSLGEYSSVQDDYNKNNVKDIADTFVITIAGSEYCKFSVEKALIKFLKTLN
jgi:hypothetical protein